MIYLSGSRNNTLDALARAGGEYGPVPVGLLLTPATASLIQPGRQNAYAWVGLDNGCFTETGRKLFTVEKYKTLYDRAVAQWGDGVLFVAVPDVPFEWDLTLTRFREYVPQLRAWGAPLALVTQDGATVDAIPWDDCDAIFVGGSDAWKCGPESAAICREAKRRGKWVHVGRVNSEKRMLAAALMGADSADGTYLKYEGPNGSPQVVEWAVKATEAAARANNPVYDEADWHVGMGNADGWEELKYVGGY